MVEVCRGEDDRGPTGLAVLRAASEPRSPERDDIVRAARRLARTAGRAGVTPHGVASDLGIDVAEVYAHAVDTDALLDLALTDEVSRLIGRILTEMPRVDPGRPKLTHAIDIAFAFLDDNRVLLPRPDGGGLRSGGALDYALDTVAEFLATEVERDRIRLGVPPIGAADLWLWATALVAGVRSAGLHWLLTGEPDRDRAVDVLAGTYWHGLTRLSALD